jgi:hypothetical protein
MATDIDSIDRLRLVGTIVTITLVNEGGFSNRIERLLLTSWGMTMPVFLMASVQQFNL